MAECTLLLGYYPPSFHAHSLMASFIAKSPVSLSVDGPEGFLVGSNALLVSVPNFRSQ